MLRPKVVPAKGNFKKGSDGAKGGYKDGAKGGSKGKAKDDTKGGYKSAGKGGWGPTPGRSVEDVETIGEEFVGTIKSFNGNSGYGFIECDDLKAVYGNDVFLHHSQLSGFEVGSVVQFAAFLNQSGKPQAKDLAEAGSETGAEAGEPAPKRARTGADEA